ncbi:MAG: transposase [Oligoflexales bacterium]|nr:transposase [Oligoflexales bacterium]
MSAAVKISPKYSRRRPELTICYRILQDHLSTFIADREAEGRPIPDYVKEEFEAFLRCGILAHGFLRLKCSCCKEEKITAFSCKKRGFCPSCCAKRQAEAATHLVQNVLPLVPYRQYVVSFPIPLRYWLQTNRKLYSKIHSIIIKQIHRYYHDKAVTKGIKDPKPGSISFTQRFGSALNLNPHCHILCPDGVYTRVDGRPKWNSIESITDDDVAALLTRISQWVMRYLKKQGLLDKDGEVVQNPIADGLFQDSESLTCATSSSIAGKIAFGPNAGKFITRIGSGFGYGEETPLAKGKLCFSVNGFSLHARTHINAHQRDGLHKLIEYLARGPLSNERLELAAEGKIKLRLKTKWSDGTTHLLLSPTAFMEKLMALIPPPKNHLVRWGGVLASNSPFRREITLKPKIKKGFQFHDESEPRQLKNRSWSRMLAQVFKIDVTKCDACGSDMVAICSVMERTSVQRYLRHLGLDPDPPARAPPRSSQGEFDFASSAQSAHWWETATT